MEQLEQLCITLRSLVKLTLPVSLRNNFQYTEAGFFDYCYSVWALSTGSAEDATNLVLVPVDNTCSLRNYPAQVLVEGFLVEMQRTDYSLARASNGAVWTPSSSVYAGLSLSVESLLSYEPFYRGLS